MLKKLQRKWKVNGIGLFLILATFALGGSLCGFVSRKIIAFTEIDKGLGWIILYILLLTITWPLCVIVVSVPLGQFTFFKTYIFKIFNRFSGKKKNPSLSMADSIPRSKLAIFASGAGSNAQKIIEHFKNNAQIKVELIVCNKPGAGVLNIARAEDIAYLVIEKERFFQGDGYVADLKRHHIQYIILAGFLWKIPLPILKEWPGAIINIHPALLPAYGGKGMYGANVHEAVIANKEKESGISIHYVDEIYDHGNILQQFRCTVLDDDTPEMLAKKIHELEHRHYPVVIEEWVKAKTALNRKEQLQHIK
jgi:formyltetrahydrofolate-dependent phosphoribosylglycinamide formyltransferase